MNQDILLSKIVPNATDTTWSQAYTTLNVYMTISIENETSKTPITSYGKELLEKLQREFFALDNKNLDEIKKAVSNVTTTISPDFKYSIIVGAIVKNILYIVTASEGFVIIKRNNRIGIIATGEEGELIGFSGELKHNDVVIFQTGDFSKKIPQTTLQEYLLSSDVSQIAENITPLIHENSKGTESAIIIQFKDLSSLQNSSTINQLPEEEAEDTQDTDRQEAEDITSENLWTKTPESMHNREIEELDDAVKEEDEMEMVTDEKKADFSLKCLK